MNKLILPLAFASSLLVAFASSLLAPPAAHAQFGALKVATAHAVARPSAIPRGSTGVLTVTLSVGAKYHINANKPNDPAYIATVFTPQPAPGIQFGAARYPTPKLMKLSYSPKPLLVYTGLVTVSVPFRVTPAAKPGMVPLSGTMSFQGCDAKSCFPPAAAPVKAVIAVK